MRLLVHHHHRWIGELTLEAGRDEAHHNPHRHAEDEGVILRKERLHRIAEAGVSLNLRGRSTAFLDVDVHRPQQRPGQLLRQVNAVVGGHKNRTSHLFSGSEA